MKNYEFKDTLIIGKNGKSVNMIVYIRNNQSCITEKIGVVFTGKKHAARAFNALSRNYGICALEIQESYKNRLKQYKNRKKEYKYVAEVKEKCKDECNDNVACEYFLRALRNYHIRPELIIQNSIRVHEVKFDSGCGFEPIKREVVIKMQIR